MVSKYSARLQRGLILWGLYGLNFSPYTLRKSKCGKHGFLQGFWNMTKPFQRQPWSMIKLAFYIDTFNSHWWSFPEYLVLNFLNLIFPYSNNLHLYILALAYILDYVPWFPRTVHPFVSIKKVMCTLEIRIHMTNLTRSKMYMLKLKYIDADYWSKEK